LRASVVATVVEELSLRPGRLMAPRLVRHLVALPTHLKVRGCDVEGILSVIAGDVER
jgi:hypothetical protein